MQEGSILLSILDLRVLILTRANFIGLKSADLITKTTTLKNLFTNTTELSQLPI